MKKRIAVLFLALVLAASSSTTALAAEASPFTDLHPEHWAYPYVSALYQAGVVGGYPDGTFQGENNVTWGEVFKLLLLAVGVEEPERDPEKHWAYPYIQLALDNRLVYAFLEEYLDAAPARLDVARMAARALDLTDISGESPYTDCADGYVVELFEKGIMNGTEEADGLRYFYPDRPISRQELSAVVWRMMNVDYHEGMFYFRNYWLDGLEGVPPIAYAPEQFVKNELGRLDYTGGYYTRGIDVSGHKGEIDWNAVAADNIDFAIIRAGNRLYGKDGSGAVLEDSWFDKNMQGAIAAGLDGKVQYALEGSVFVGGAVIQWLRDELHLITEAADSEYFARKVPGSGGVYVVPAFTGLGAPHWDMYARGAILGLTRGAGRDHIIRAALESIAYQVSDVLDAMRADSGIALASLKVDGGASANNVLMQIQADILQTAVNRPVCVETTALGAAYLAGLAVGFWSGLEDVERNWAVDRTFTPAIAPGERAEKLRGWRRAVERSFRWAEE